MITLLLQCTQGLLIFIVDKLSIYPDYSSAWFIGIITVVEKEGAVRRKLLSATALQYFPKCHFSSINGRFKMCPFLFQFWCYAIIPSFNLKDSLFPLISTQYNTLNYPSPIWLSSVAWVKRWLLYTQHSNNRWKWNSAELHTSCTYIQEKTNISYKTLHTEIKWIEKWFIAKMRDHADLY